MISAVSVSPIFPFSAFNQRSLFLEGKEEDSSRITSKAWTARPPPPVSLLLSDTSMTSALGGGPGEGVPKQYSIYYEGDNTGML